MLRLLTLGGFALARDGIPVPGVTSHALAVLIRVAAAGDRGISRQKLTGCFWPERDERHARHSLSQALYELRLAVRGETLVVGRDVLRLSSACVSCDMLDLERALHDGDLELASTLHAGPFLDGIYLTGADEFERWSETQRRRLVQELARALRAASSSAIDAGDHPTAIRWLHRLADLDPLDFATALDLVRVMAATGDDAGARRRAQEYVALVHEELGTEPGREMLDLLGRLERESRDPAARFSTAGIAVEPARASRPPMTAAELCARARQCLHTFTPESYAEGIALARRAIGLDPMHAESYVTLGSLYVVLSQVDPRDGRRARGSEYCRHAAALEPGLAEAWLWQAWAHMLDERFDDAGACARRGVRLDPDGPFSHYVLAWTCMSEGLRLGRWSRCVDGAVSYRRVLSLHPRELHALMPLTSLYALAGQYDGAARYCEQALDVERSSAVEMRVIGARVLGGLLDFRRGRLEEGRLSLELALREYASATQFFAPYVRALALCGLGDLDRHDGFYDDAVSRYLEGLTLLAPVPGLLGCGYVVARLELRLAGAFRRLRMRHEELVHLRRAEELMATRASHNFNVCWEANEALLHYDWAVYHATCGDLPRTLAEIEQAVEHGWNEPAALQIELAFEFSRGDNEFRRIFDLASARQRLPDVAGVVSAPQTGVTATAVHL